jgi:uncharacterized metal-binding protein YceD (DUF177 family)
MNNALEFSRPLNVDRIPPEGCTETISADPAECAELAKRFGLIAIHSLAAHIEAQPVSGRGVKLKARIHAEVEQTCVVSLDNFTATVETEAQRIYLPEGSLVAKEDAVETDTIKGDSIDLGEFVAEEMGLALDPYPRKPGVAFQSAEETHNAAGSPFSKLSKLKPRH